MESMESAAFEQTILKLGLVNEGQLAEVHDEIGEVPDLQQFIAALERKAYLTPWQRGKVLKGDPDGYILGGYKLLYKIQSGSFGRVYRAVDSRDGRGIAVKVLRRRWSENEQRIEMFIREGKVGLLLKHPNIVEVLAINRDPSSGQYYIVMEFVEGGNLREILQIRQKLNVAESLRLVEDSANGLAYAYSRGMTHRDIKLTNLLISDTGEAKLVDFGLAQFFSAFARTEDEKVDRTVDYAGLEKATEVKMGDVRSDIYFLGCVLYECLTGRSPLTMTRDKHARMRKGRFEEVRPIHPNEIDGPPSVLLLVETMMALDPKARYQTPSQLVDAVRRVRREVEGKSGNGDDRPQARSVFLAEPDERLQEVLRDGLKDQGYRVFLAGDPLRALDRFHKQPYDGLIVDARTTGEDGFRVFESIIDEAARRRLRCAALLLLDEEQTDWAQRLSTGPHVGVMSQDITFKTVTLKLKELMDAALDSEEVPTLVRPAPLPPPAPPPPPPSVAEPPQREETAKPTPPPSTPRTLEIPTRKSGIKAPKPVARIIEISPSKEAAPPRRDPKPAAVSPPPPPREEVPPPPPPPRRDPMAAVFSPPSPRGENAPPPRRDPMAAAFGPSGEDDFPMLAQEEGLLLPPHEEAIPTPRRQESTPPPPTNQESGSSSRHPQAAAPLRRAEPRRRRDPQPITQHITHEDPLAAPDTHHWREELGVKEQKEQTNISGRMQKVWESLTPTQKSIGGITLIALVVGLFFTNMIFNMLVENKFNKIEENMTIDEVESILGSPGEKVELNSGRRGRGPVNQVKTETRKWQISGKTFSIIFSNGRVVMKQIQEE